MFRYQTRYHWLFILSVGLLILLTSTASWAEVTCGAVIGPNKIVYLKKDLTCDASDTGGNPALTVEANSVLFLGGNSVTCDGIAVGIRLQGSSSFLGNGIVTNCETAVAVEGTGGHTIRGVTAIGNTLGFNVSPGSDGNQLTSNTSKNGGENGFEIESDGNELVYNTSKGHSGVGFLAETANSNVFKNNLATLNVGGGFLFRGDDNTLTKNRAMANPTGDGFFIEGNGNKISKNWSQNQTIGFGFVVSGDSNHLLMNHANKNGVHGMVLLEGSEFTVVLGNTANKNKQIGISVGNTALNNTLIGNVAFGNDVDLADANTDPPCDNNTWKANFFRTSNPPRPSCIK